MDASSVLTTLYLIILPLLAVYGFHRSSLVYLYYRHKDKQPVEPGKLEVAWNGNTDSGDPAPVGRYQVRAVVNSGLKAQYVTSACSPGSTPRITNMATMTPSAARTYLSRVRML